MSSTVTPGNKRQQQKADTRATLRRAAHDCFAEQGFVATQVGDIARRAGVAHGTFYVHFESKEALLDDLLTAFNAAFVAKLEQAWPADAEPHAVARALAGVCLDHWNAERGLVAAFAERAGVDGSLAGLRDGISPPVAAFLAARLRELGSDLPDAELIAQGVLGLWTRVGLQYLFGDTPRQRAIDTLAAMSVGALSAVIPALQKG